MVRYNGYPAMSIAGDAAPGRSTGEAIAEMERLAKQLPAGFGFEWTKLSREEKLAGARGWSCMDLPSWRCFCASLHCTRAGRFRSP